MAAALAGEASNLDVVVYACCDMLNACELANDVERAAQWCRVTDDFVRTYGCPFLYAECRINYGSVLAATGHWPARRARAGGRAGRPPPAPARRCTPAPRRAWPTLRVRQGRLEDAAALLDDAPVDPERALALAALRLARDDGPWRPAGARPARRCGGATSPAVFDVARRRPPRHRRRRRRGVGGDGLAAAAGARQARAAEAEARGRLAGARRRRRRAPGRRSRTPSTRGPRWASRTRRHGPAPGLAGVLRAADPALAAEHARRALDAFDELGATPGRRSDGRPPAARSA